MLQPYLVLARKWRPTQFSHIVGQNHIVRTLTQALSLGRIHQAYLFAGSRGIGKTSIARIFAKNLRCTQPTLVSGLQVTCDCCPSCLDLLRGSSLDVTEMDAASHNGVDAIREIRDQTQYLPASGERKIYILDEVHMLTTAAFNALLKTLEEPPPHVVFIFATTEPQKIPATILSRCQRFDYRRVTTQQMKARMHEILAAEAVSIEPAALDLVIKAAEGSMRDALSLLDQLIAYGGQALQLQHVYDCIGLIPQEILLQVLKSILTRNPAQALAESEQAFQKGLDLKVLTRGLLEFLHALFLIQVQAVHPQLISEFSEAIWSELVTLATLRPQEEMELIFQVLHHGLDALTRSPQPKILFDLILIKCATTETLMDLESLPTPSSTPPAVTGPANARLSTTPPPPPSSPTPARSWSPEVSRPSQVPASLSFETPPITAPTTTTAHAAAPLPFPAWESIVNQIRASRPLIASLLEHAVGVEFTPTSHLQQPGSELQLLLTFRAEDVYFRDQLQSRVYQELLVRLLRETLQRTVRIQIELKNLSGAPESLAAKQERLQHEQRQQVHEAAVTHPVLKEARLLFGGELGAIEIFDDERRRSGHPPRPAPLQHPAANTAPSHNALPPTHPPSSLPPTRR